MKWPPIANLLPHAGDVILLDGVTRYDEDGVQASATVRPSVFSEADGSLPGWVGVELMAQAIAAWAGCRARLAGRPPAVGFLLGTRRYECTVERFPSGAALQLEAIRSLHDATGIAVFECAIDRAGVRLASARLSVYAPPDPSTYLQEEN